MTGATPSLTPFSWLHGLQVSSYTVQKGAGILTSHVITDQTMHTVLKIFYDRKSLFLLKKAYTGIKVNLQHISLNLYKKILHKCNSKRCVCSFFLNNILIAASEFTEGSWGRLMKRLMKQC
jgi:hypothetical protein